MWTGEDMVWVFNSIAEGALVVILMLRLKQLGSTAKNVWMRVWRRIFAGLGEGQDSGVKCRPVDGV